MPSIDGKLIVLICTFVGLAICEQNKVIKSITPTIVRSVGEEAVLTCTTVENPSSVVWVKKSKDDPSDSTPLSFGDVLTLKDPRFNLTATPNNYSLHIRNIEYSDAASYVCQVIFSVNNKESATVELLVRHPPKIAQNIEITPPVATIGGTAELKCTADGYPRPTISWIRENDEILPHGGAIYIGDTLKINNVAPQDRGLYYCIADNHIENSDRRAVNFEVEFPPKISVPRPRVGQALYFDTELECIVEGFPSPSIVWYRDGKQLLSDSDQSITTTATVNSVSTSVLHIITVEQEQYGDYECRAENKLGSANATVNLFQSLVAVYPWQANGVRVN